MRATEARKRNSDGGRGIAVKKLPPAHSTPVEAEGAAKAKTHRIEARDQHPQHQLCKVIRSVSLEGQIVAFGFRIWGVAGIWSIRARAHMIDGGGFSTESIPKKPNK